MNRSAMLRAARAVMDKEFEGHGDTDSWCAQPIRNIVERVMQAALAVADEPTSTDDVRHAVDHYRVVVEKNGTQSDVVMAVDRSLFTELIYEVQETASDHDIWVDLDDSHVSKAIEYGLRYLAGLWRMELIRGKDAQALTH